MSETEVQPVNASVVRDAETSTSVTIVDDESTKFLSVKKGKQLLHQLESAISKGIKDFWTVGESLARIRDEGLFRLRYSGEDYRSFGDYLEDRWGYSRGYQLIKAAKVRRTMIDIGIKNPDSVCSSERQYRECDGLLKVAAEPEKLSQLKESIKAERKLTNEIFGREIRKLLPLPKENVPRSVSEKSLEKRLAKLKTKFENELDAIKARHPAHLDVIAAWVKSLASV